MEKSKKPGRDARQRTGIGEAVAAIGAGTAKGAAHPVPLPDEGPAFPILDVFEHHLHIGATKGYDLVNSGQLETFLIGKRRYATLQAIQRFVGQCVAASFRESREDRSRKVARTVAGRARRRQEAQRV